MIRLEFFFDGYRIGIEAQFFTLNFQTSLGFSLLHEISIDRQGKKGWHLPSHFFVGLGPWAMLGWIDRRKFL
jgi:hypothetical protein